MTSGMQKEWMIHGLAQSMLDRVSTQTEMNTTFHLPMMAPCTFRQTK